jgi:hypothetical protein
MNKSQLGQYYTTNYDYILEEFIIPKSVGKIIEPFAGEGHLTQFCKNQNYSIIEEYDIEPKKDEIIERDTLLNPPSYLESYIITNPPYLARNKSKDKTIFDLYNENDLYKCFMRNLINNNCNGGIVIIPLNFISSIRRSDVDLRRDFIDKYQIEKVRIFEEQVFDDTPILVCVLQFSHIKTNKETLFEIYPKKNTFQTHLNKENNFTIGGEIYNLNHSGNIQVERLTKNNQESKNTNILLKCIDDNNENRLGLSFKEDDKDLFIDCTEKLSARAYATLKITPELDIEQQKDLVLQFNNYLNEMREKYHSLFLTNYRESKDCFARKRISMSLAYDIVKHLLNK